jgi:RNase P/RNase MRP subunit p29
MSMKSGKIFTGCNIQDGPHVVMMDAARGDHSMKTVTKVLSVMLILGLAGVAEAKKQKDNSGIKGRIVSVSTHSITIKEKGNGTQQVTIKIDANTTIEVDGVSSQANKLQAGQRVKIQGGTDGPATDIQATSHKGGKHKAA